MQLTPSAAYAVGRAKDGHPVLLLCWPDANGRCVCPGEWDPKARRHAPHTGKDIGKAPLTEIHPHGWKSASADVETVTAWCRTYPNANVGEPLEPNDWLIIDPDSQMAQAEAHKLGLPPTPIRRSRNDAYVTRRPADCPATNVTRRGASGQLDVLGTGYVVTFGQHREGQKVRLDGGEPKAAPRWAVDWLTQEAGKRESAKQRSARRVDDATGEPPVRRLSEYELRVWHGEVFKSKKEGGLDRSGSLVKLARAIWNRGASRSAVVRALAERDETLGWHKFTGRPDANAQYHKVVDELERQDQEPSEQEAAVTEAEAIIGDTSAAPAGGNGDLVCLPRAELENLRSRIAEYWTLLVQQQAIIRNASFTPGKRIALLGALLTIGEAEDRAPGQEHVYHRGLVAKLYNVSKDLAGEASATLEQLGVITKRSEAELVSVDFKTGEPLPRPEPHVITRVRPTVSKLDAWSTVASFNEPRPERAKAARGKPRCPLHADAETTLAYICTICRQPVEGLNPVADVGFDATPALCTEKSSIGLTPPSVVTPALIGDSSVHRDEPHAHDYPEINPSVDEAAHELLDRGRLLGFPELSVGQGWGIAAGEDCWQTFAESANGRLGFALEAVRAAALLPRSCADCGKPTNNPELSRCYRCRFERGEIRHPKMDKPVLPPSATPELPIDIVGVPALGTGLLEWL